MANIIRMENNRIFIMDLLKHLLLFDKEDTIEKISPSRFAKEMQLNVEQRLKLLNDRSRKQKIGQHNKLYAIPDVVVFQNFETHVKYTTSISFMHQKQYPVRIKVYPDLSPCYTLHELPGTVYSKLAPGTPHKLTLDFYSEEERDYMSFIRFEAEDDVIYLPIIALAPRPLLIFPDVIELPETVVNITSDKRVFMRNSGKSQLVFKLQAETPFSICPKTGILQPDGVLDVKVSYKTCKVDRNISELIITFEGVNLTTTLICEAKNCEIYLDKTILYFEDTFLNLQRCISLNLVNSSAYTMKYQWKQFETKYIEMEKCREYRLKLKDVNEYEVLRNIQDENPNITDAELHKTFLQRIYDDEVAEFDSTDQFIFHDGNFKFLEPSGTVGPYSTVTMEVTFCPDEADSYERWAYLDVTGRETRQPLKLVGTGLGPEVSLNVKVLDVENLYLCAKHQYEIVAKNEGIIPATLTYCHKSLDFGGSMTCTPDEIYIDPGKCEKVVMEFSSTVQGKFLEYLSFRISESEEHIGFIFQGNVVCPLLSYDVEELDFGAIAFGFAVEKELSIQNTTEVPIEFKISVMGDGSDEAITWVNFSRSHDPNAVSITPKEFNIYPDEATVDGNSSVNIKITLVPNKARHAVTAMHTYMWGSKKHYVELPIHYDCIVPTIICTPPKLDIRYCFINFPYDRTFTLKNISEVPGYLLYNDTEEDYDLTCKLSLTESYIEPLEEITIHLEIKALQLGLRTKHLDFIVFGQESSTLCKLTCDVQGPVVCVNPEDIKFGAVPLLKWHNRILHVMNDSPVAAFISITVANPTFHIYPCEFMLEASERLEVEISIYLTDVGKYSSTIILNVVNTSDPLKVNVTVVGTGSCVLFEPILEPKYDLGTLMTHNFFAVLFKMTNMGSNAQKLYFSRLKEMRMMRDDTPPLKGNPFIIEPNLIELRERETKTATIEVYNTNPGPTDLMYYCYSGDKGAKFTKIFDVKLTAHFEDPVLSLSKSALNFRFDVTIDETIACLTEMFTVTNETYLALDIYVSLNSPFFLNDEIGNKLSTINANIPSKKSLSFQVEFVPPEGEKRCSTSTGTMKIGFKLHPRTFLVPLTGDVHYPTILTYPDAIKKQYIAPMANCSKELIIKNISPLTVAYKYEWEVTSYTIEKLPTPRCNLSSIGDSIDWDIKKFQDIYTPKDELTPEEATSRYTLEILFQEPPEAAMKLPCLNKMYEIFLQNLRYPHIHPEIRRKMYRLCNLVLGPIVQNEEDEEKEYMKLLENMPEVETNVNDAMLNITPYQGCLQPYECNLVNFYIRPPPQTFIRATVKCQILGGAEEKIEVTGICGDIAFDLDTTVLDFGNQLFCEVIEAQLVLTNTGHVGFECSVLDDCTSTRPKNPMDPGWLQVAPNIGMLEPGETVPLQVKYYPGITGEFSDIFTVEIAYLGPVSVQVNGFGVYSQLSMDLPRPNLVEESDIYLCYTAIANLTSEKNPLHPAMKTVFAGNALDEITSLIMQREDWVIVDFHDVNVPSLVDIDMAIERMIGYDFLQNNPQLLGESSSIRKKSFTIPNFSVPAYNLSFGNVRLDGQYQHDIALYSYGPGACTIRVSFRDKKSFDSKGFHVSVAQPRIRLKEFVNMTVSFKPDVKGFNYQQPYIMEQIYVEVYQGARIPIDISASVGVPTIQLSTQCVDFCGVVVGNCKRKTICLHNSEFVEAKWKCTLDSPLFFVRKQEGLLQAGESEDLHVFFEPKAKGPRQGIITFSVEGNAEDCLAYLNGYGLEPRFVIKDRCVMFQPVLQYSPPLEETFLVQNTSSFVNEVFLSDYDKNIGLHERITNVYWKMKNAKKVYVAQSRYGNTPSNIYKFLYKEMLIEKLRKEKSFTEMMAVSKTDITDLNPSVDRLLETFELRVESSFMKKKLPQDIFIDPELEVAKPEDVRTTKIIVFHGNKYTDYVKAANDASRKLQIQRYTLDGMIIDILVQNSSPFTREVNQIIEDAYFIRMEPDDCFCRENAIEDQTSEIWRKLNAILTTEPVLRRTKARKEEKEKDNRPEKFSVASSKMSRKTIAPNTADTFQGIPEGMIIQILSDKIDQIDKMILESLDSIFLPNIQVALRCFLKAAKSISCLYFVFFTCTLEEHITIETKELQKKEDVELSRREVLRKKLLEIDDYTKLSEEEMDIVLEIQNERRRNQNEKRQTLRMRIQEALNNTGRQKKATDLRNLWGYIDKPYRCHTIAGAKISSKTLKTSGSHTQSLSFAIKDAKESREKDSKGSKESKSSKGSQKSAKQSKERALADDTAFYFYKFDIMLSEMLHLLEHWDRKNLEMTKPFPNFGALMTGNRKETKYSSKKFMGKLSRTRSKSKSSSTLFAHDDAEDTETVVSTNFDPYMGYPVWLINQAHQKRSVDVVTPIINLLKKMITINCLTPAVKVCSEAEVVYSVLKKPAHRKPQEYLDVFELIKNETKEEEGEKSEVPIVADNETITTSRSSSFLAVSLNKKKTKKRKLTLTPTVSDIALMNDVCVRVLMQPGQVQELTVRFKPLYAEVFRNSYHFEAVGTHYKDKVEIVARCDYPKIDTSPTTMFPHHVQNIDSKSMFLNGVYVVSQQMLDFGTILLIPQNLLEMKSTISMMNISTMICNVVVAFRNKSEIFYCYEEEDITIKPGMQHCLSVYAKPPSEGLFKETLLIIIKDNPRIQHIHLSCFACPLKFEVTPHNVNFNKVILGKTESEKIRLKNLTSVMVYFELEFDLTSEFHISTFNGYLDPCSVHELTVSFLPQNVGDRKESIIVKVFDTEKQFPQPIHTEVVTLLSEVATFPLEYSTEIDLGLVKGKTPHFFPFTISNTGKYDVRVIMTKPKDVHGTWTICEYFKMKHMEYVVKGETKYSNNCRFICNKELEFSDAPVVHVTILDNYRNSAIDFFTFRASAKVALSKFELCPYGEYFFGYQNVNTTRSNILTLKNIGCFEFRYTILTPEIVEEQARRKLSKKEGVDIILEEKLSSIPSLVQSDIHLDKNLERSTIDSRRKARLKSKSRNLVAVNWSDELKADIFTIIPSTGMVLPGEAVSISIQSKPEECKSYQNSIIFFVSEPSFEDRKGRVLNLHLDGTEPYISFNDHHFMYPEQYIVKNIDDLPYVGENSVFETDKQLLNFGKVAIHRSMKTRFRIPNTGHVTATVYFDIREKNCAFVIGSKVIDISPYKAEFNTIEFLPKSIGVWTGTVDIRCQGFSSKHILTHQIYLTGEACMPTIEILEPKFRKIVEQPHIQFDPIRVNSSVEKTIVLKNTGRVPCNVIVEICEDPRRLFSLSTRNESGFTPNQMKREDKIGIGRSNTMYLNSEEKGFVHLKFHSPSVANITAELKIFAVDNCYDIFKLPVIGQCFFSNITLDGLETVVNDRLEIAYHLTFGPVYENEMNKFQFKIKNHSQLNFKFEFSQLPCLTFYPRVGHLYGGTEKSIIAGFFTKRKICFNEEKVSVTITEIAFQPEQMSSIPWDDRQTCNIVEPKTPQTDEVSEVTDILTETISFDEVVLENPEPSFTAVSIPFEIPLLVTAQCDFSNYYCEIRELIFPYINLHTESVKSIWVENRSKMNLEIQWQLIVPEELLPVEDPSLFEKIGISQIHPEVKSVPSKLGQYLATEAFRVEPEICSIPPDREQEFKITFSPSRNSLHECVLKANMRNLQIDTSDLEIVLKGETQELPYQFQSTHLEDFMQSDSRFKTYCGHISEQNAKILNFLSLGIGTESNRTVYITNDASIAFTYTWKKVKIDSEKSSFFHCEFRKGHINPGKISQTNFVFIPQYQGTFTDSFEFIPENPEMPKSSVLMQGVCREPKVYFEHPFLSLGTMILNTLVDKQICLRNDEDQKIHFKFKKNTLFSGDQQLLSVFPRTGMIEPMSKIEIRFSSKCDVPGETIFNPRCIVQHMSEPLWLNVITNVIAVSSVLVYYSRELNKTEVRPNTVTVINLGVIIPHKREEIRFELENTCNVGFYYCWTTTDKQYKSIIQFTQHRGYLTSKNKIRITASITAVRKCDIKNVMLKLSVLYGSTYTFRIEASADRPMYTFSFLKYDFGKCLVQQEPSKYYRTDLIFTNNNTWPIIIETGPNITPEFFIDFKSAAVNSNESETIRIFFSPLDLRIYETTVAFTVCSNKVSVKLSGEGVPLLLDVLSLNEKFLDFEAVRVGKTAQKTVQILNAGEATVDVFFDLYDRLPFLKKVKQIESKEFLVKDPSIPTTPLETPSGSKHTSKKGKPPEKEIKAIKSFREDKSLKISSKEKLLKNGGKRRMSDKISRSFIMKSLDKLSGDSEMLMMQMKEELNRFLLDSLEILPKKFIRIPPGKTTELLVKFKPTKCTEQFQANIFFEVQQYKEQIISIIGSAVDANFKLNKEVINFGNVVVGYSNESSVVLINEGYFGGKFKWYLEKNSSYVSFVGGEGYSPPNSKVTTSIIFKPGHVQCVFRFKAFCQIEHYAKRLELILTGGAMNVPPPLDTIQLAAAVREEDSYGIEFKNETKEEWNTRPTFTGNFFSGEDVLIVPKESTVSYKVTYAPMKLSNVPHKGTVFFSLPSGFSRLYSLEGIVSPPEPVEEILREIKCKTYHTEILRVENWLGLRQQLRVITEVVEGDSTRMIYKITSNDLMEISPFGKRDFKWTIYVINDGKLSLKVTFMNEKTREYLYYIIILKISASEDSIETIKFTTCVRVPVTKKIVVKNPLDEPLSYTAIASSSYLLMENLFSVPPYGKYELAVKYLPLKVESATATLQISNPQVGGYTYNLIINAQAANSEPEVYFRTQLGQTISKTIFLPRVLQNCDVHAKITDNNAFELIRINTQTEKPSAEVGFEPFLIGTTRGALQIVSFLGEYTYPLVGESIHPEPRGPLSMVAGETISIDFTNPFEDHRIFQFSVDDNFFQIKPPFETIKGKKSTKISISTAASGSRMNSLTVEKIEKVGIITSKLSIVCEHENALLKWIYYLQCKFPNK